MCDPIASLSVTAIQLYPLSNLHRMPATDSLKTPVNDEFSTELDFTVQILLSAHAGTSWQDVLSYECNKSKGMNRA